MKTNLLLAAGALILTVGAARADNSITGEYLEVRSCDVYTGPCFANSEMNLTGKEGILVWSVRQGSWDGTALDGLRAIAVVHTDGTLGDLHYQPRIGKAVLILDAKANPPQRAALTDFVKAMAGSLVQDIVRVTALPITADLAACDKAGCAKVQAGDLVEISTRCLGGKDHICGNESTFYPPLISVTHAIPAFTEVASFTGRGLGLTWQATGQRSAFLGTFSTVESPHADLRVSLR
jgi:hypothetical protein